MTIMNKKFKKLYIIIAMLVISIIFETLLFGYYVFVKKMYTKKHLIGNTPTIIEKDALDLDDELDKWGYRHIKFKNALDGVYNIELIMKETTNDTYIRVFYEKNDGEDEVLMQKADKEERIFKAYLTGENLRSFQIVYHKDSINFEQIEEIRINDNLDYIIEPNFSVLRICIYFAILLSIYGLILLLKLIERKELKIKKEYIFLILGSVIGIVMCFTNVILSKYDEHAHFWRAYEIADGTIFSGHSEGLPSSIFDVVINEDGVYEIEKNASYANQKEGLEIQLNPEELTSRLVGSSAGASPFSYIPQIVGVEIGRLLKLNPLLIATAGRITNLISYLVLMFLAIKFMPKEKWKNLIMTIGLLPMSMNLAASLSPDAIIVSTLTLAVSYIMKLKFGKNKIRIINIVILTTLFTIVVLCKVVYFPLILMTFLIPNKLYKNNIQKWVYLGIIPLVVALIWMLWQHAPAPVSEVAISTSPTEQLYFTLADPLRDLYTLGNTVWNNTDSYIGRMLGGWNTPFAIMAILGLILLIATFDTTKEEVVLKKKEKIFIVLLCAAVMFLIYAGLYVTWSRAQSTIAQGIQGRYFLPILLVMLMALESDRITIKVKNLSFKYMLITIMLYIPIWASTIQYFNK